MSSAYFKGLCDSLLKGADAEILRFCTIDPALTLKAADTGSSFVDGWIDAEKALRYNLAYMRAAALKRPAAAEPPHDTRAETVAKTALSMGDPLEAELYIDKARWETLDALTGITIFDVKVIFAYYIKLQLLERKQSFNTEAGFAEYKSLYESIMNASQSVMNAGAIGNNTGESQ
jgi:hypothetical protein